MENFYDKVKRIRDLALQTKVGLGLKVEQFCNLMNDTIENNRDKIRLLKILKHTKSAKGGWNSILFGKEPNVEYDGVRWNEIEIALNIMAEGLKLPKLNKESFYTKSVKYGVFPCQDTLLPYYFAPERYRQYFSIRPSWNKVIEDFQTESLEVTLHNFSTAIALSAILQEPFFFFPFFTFNGYGLFTKIIQEYDFSKMNLQSKKEYWYNAEIMIEQNSDMEWILYKYCQRLQYDWNIISKNIVNTNVNSAKELFVKSTKPTIYFANSIHIHDLETKCDFLLIEKDSTLTDHKNFNGIICKYSFYEENQVLIDKLIEIWFKDITEFDEQMRKIGITNSRPNNTHHLEVLKSILLEYTFVDTDYKFLASMYTHNKFHHNKEGALLSFKSQLENIKIISNYLGIANYQLGKNTKYDNTLLEKYLNLIISKI